MERQKLYQSILDSLNSKHKYHYNTVSRVPTKEKSSVYIPISPKLNMSIFQIVVGGAQCLHVDVAKLLSAYCQY